MFKGLEFGGKYYGVQVLFEDEIATSIYLFYDVFKVIFRVLV